MTWLPRVMIPAELTSRWTSTQLVAARAAGAWSCGRRSRRAGASLAKAGQVGMPHAGQTVTIELGDTNLRVIDQHGEFIATVPRDSTGEISRYKAYGTRQPR